MRHCMCVPAFPPPSLSPFLPPSPIALVDDAPVGQQQQVVEELDDFGRRLQQADEEGALQIVRHAPAEGGGSQEGARWEGARVRPADFFILRACAAEPRPPPTRLKVRTTEYAVAESRPVLISSANHSGGCQPSCHGIARLTHCDSTQARERVGAAQTPLNIHEQDPGVGQAWPTSNLCCSNTAPPNGGCLRAPGTAALLHVHKPAALTHEHNGLLPHHNFGGGQPLALAAADAAHLGGPDLGLLGGYHESQGSNECSGVTGRHFWRLSLMPTRCPAVLPWLQLNAES